MAISDALLYDLLSILKLKQIPLAIEVLRERLTARDLTRAYGIHAIQLATHVEVRTLDEHTETTQ